MSANENLPGGRAGEASDTATPDSYCPTSASNHEPSAWLRRAFAEMNERHTAGQLVRCQYVHAFRLLVEVRAIQRDLDERTGDRHAAYLAGRAEGYATGWVDGRADRLAEHAHADLIAALKQLPAQSWPQHRANMRARWAEAAERYGRAAEPWPVEVLP